jgi:hypothetical protein
MTTSTQQTLLAVLSFLTAALCTLLGKAVFIGVRAENTTIAWLGAEKRTTAGARIERHSSINGHCFHLFEAAFRAADCRSQVRH